MLITFLVFCLAGIIEFIYLFYHNAQESTGRKQRKDHHSVI